MKLNVYKNQREVAKTFEVDTYDLMYGTVEDILGIFSGYIEANGNEDAIIKVILENKPKVDDLLLDIFPDLTHEDLRKTKVPELIPLFVELFDFVKSSLSNIKN